MSRPILTELCQSTPVEGVELWMKPKCIAFFFFFPLHFSSPDGLGQDMLSSSDKGILGQCYLRFFHNTYTQKERKELIFFQLKCWEDKQSVMLSTVCSLFSMTACRSAQGETMILRRLPVCLRHSVERSSDETSSLVSLAADPSRGALRFWLQAVGGDVGCSVKEIHIHPQSSMESQQKGLYWKNDIPVYAGCPEREFNSWKKAGE